MALTEKKCVPCEGGVSPLDAKEIGAYAKQTPEWEVVSNHHLKRAFEFRNFADALAFVNGVGVIAEQEQHHPELHLGWGHAEVEIWTHAIDGLHENDFILAAKIDEMHSGAVGHG
jgi:4a-hydroxytetrahydrobiopterin dehydratase